MIKSFLAGINGANRGWKIILTLLAANLLLSLPIVIPIFLLIVGASGGTLAADRLFADKLDAIWFIDLVNQQFPGVAIETSAAQTVALLTSLGIGYLLLNTLLAGGVIDALNSEDGRFTARRFWGESGAYFWRFFRLALISLIFYAAAFGIYELARWPIDSAADKASAFGSIAYERWAAMALLALMCLFVNMAIDYAKISTVINGRRGMFRETFRAFRFSFRNFFNAFGLYLLIALVSADVFLAFNTLRWHVNQSSMAQVALALLLGQIAVAGRMWGRLVFYGAEANLYKKLAPVPATIPSAVALPIEFARAEAAAASHTPDAPDAPETHETPDAPETINSHVG
jgi:hypothetical protein